jgi:RND family efflux transporter MFP subunit
VTEVLFSAGQKMQAGEPLLRLDAEAETLTVELTRLNLEDARQQRARYEPLASAGAVSASQIYQVRTEFLVARIALAHAELALTRRLLVAPFTGVVGIPEVEVGQRVTPETRIADYDDRANLLIEFEVPELFARGVKLGAPLKVFTWAGRKQPFIAHVETIGSRIDPTSRSLRVRALLPNAEDRFRPGMSFSVTLALGGRDYPAVSTVAVQWNREGAYVWLIRGGKAEAVRVKVLKRSDGKMLLDGPLSPADLVVVEGVQRLRPGRKVRMRRAPAQAATRPFRGN